MTELEIIVLANHKFVSSHVVSDREITIGSGAGCTIQLPPDGVASEHAIVHFTGRSCIIEDLEKGSGITVKGERVASHMVKSDDEVGVAGYVLRFVIHKDEAEHAPAAAPAPAPTPLRQPDNLVSMVGRAAPQAQAQAQAQAKAAAPAAKIDPAPVKVEAKAEPKIDAWAEAKTQVAPAPKPQPKPEAKIEAAPTAQPLPKTQPLPPKEQPAAKAPPAAKPQRSEPSHEIATRVILTNPAPAAAAAAHHDDDDEDEDENFEPTFSLVSQLTQAKRVDMHGPLVAEAIFYADEQISHVRYLASGRRLKIDGEQRMVVAHNRDGRLQIASRDPIRAHIFKDGRAQSTPATQKGKLHLLALPPDTTASVELNKSERLHLQFRAELPPPPAAKQEQRLSKAQLWVVGGSLLFHAFAFVFIGLTSGDKTEVKDPNAGRFAEIQTKDLELQKPEPPPPPPPKQEIKTPEPKPEPMPKQPALAKKMPTPTKSKPTPSPAQAAPAAHENTTPKPSAAASNLLSALGGQLSGGTPTSAAAAATTNLDAVQAPRGGGFKVAGVIGKMPGDGLRLGSAGGAVGRIDTKSAAEFGGKVGKVEGSAPSGKVRGVVTEPPARSVEVQGSLDRGEIQKVVNAHLHEVQACYERQLVHDPNLSGKVVAEWVITLSGSVGTTKIKNSTVRGGEVASCIQAAIKRWTFPHPKGGSVTVTYPFVFSTVGL